MAKILLVDDEPRIARVVRDHGGRRRVAIRLRRQRRPMRWTPSLAMRPTSSSWTS